MRSIDDAIRSELESAVSTVPSVHHASLAEIERRAGRRRGRARMGVAVTAVVTVAAVGAVTVVIAGVGSRTARTDSTIPFAGTSIDAADVVIAGEGFPVDGVVGPFAEVPMFYGAVAPTPAFNRSGFGEEFRLEKGQVKVADPDILEGPTIYIGEVGTMSMFLNEQSTGKCLWIGATPQICADSGGFELSPPRTGRWYGAWLGAPVDTSVIILRSDGSVLGWQQPVGRVSLVPLPGPGSYQLIALDDNGDELEVVEIAAVAIPDAGIRLPGAPTTTRP